MTVGLTYDLQSDYQFRPGDPPDANAEFDRPPTIDAISAAIESQGFQVERIGSARRLLERLGSLSVDIVLNICEGFRGRNRESEVPLLLEMAGIPCVGADAFTMALTLDKLMAKKAFAAEGIPTPRCVQVTDAGRLPDTGALQYPLLVKPRLEGSSKGLTEKSRVETREQLAEQAARIIAAYGQPALVEEFIAGQEFTVALVGNDPVEALPVVQVEMDGRLDLGDQFYTFERIAGDRVQYRCPAHIGADLEARMRDLAVRTFQAVECRDFGRVDFRVAPDGRPYVLEINPLPALSTEDVFPVVARAVGLSYNQMIGRILHAGLARYGLA